MSSTMNQSILHVYTVREKGKKRELILLDIFYIIFFFAGRIHWSSPSTTSKGLPTFTFLVRMASVYFREHPSQKEEKKTRVVLYLLFFSHLLVKHHMPFRTVHYNSSWVQLYQFKSFFCEWQVRGRITK